jgi:hypothetical protein
VRNVLALVVGVALATSSCGNDSLPSAERTPPAPVTQSQTIPPTPPAPPVPPVPPVEETPTQTVYYLGPGPDGPDAPEAALYRYDEPQPSGAGTILDALTATPSDPDYRTAWKRGSFRGVGDPEVGQSVVRLAPSVPLDRPAGMSELEAELAVQQVVLTVREYYSEHPDVLFVQGNRPVDSVLGVPTEAGLVRAAPALSVLSHVNIAEPVEGAVVSDQLVVRGLANGFEGTVACYLEHPSGSALWADATIAGWQEERLFPFELEVDLTYVPSGTYVVRCSTDDPTAGTEGRGSDSDTRTVVVDNPGGPDALQPIYYVGLDADGGPALFRCLEPNDTGEPNHGTGGYLGELTDHPTDPAYWTWWRRNTFTGVLDSGHGVMTVEVRDPSYVRPRRSMTDADAHLALQQLAWTMGAEAIQMSVDEAFGIDTSQPIARQGPPPPSC